MWLKPSSIDQDGWYRPAEGQEGKTDKVKPYIITDVGKKEQPPAHARDCWASVTRTGAVVN